MSVALISLFDHWSAGNRSLHSVMNSEGIETDLIFFHILYDIYKPPTPESFDSLIALLKDLNPELVGISLRSQFWWVAKRIALRIKDELKIPVALGGVHVTLNPDESIEVADIICRGEGEAALTELARRLREGKPIHDIPGLWVRKPDGEVVRNDPTIAVHDMDALPMPVTDRSYQIYPNGEAHQSDPLFDNKGLTNYYIAASRGCPFKCSFCCESVYKKILEPKSGHVRRRSVEHLFEELSLAKKLFPNLGAIFFLDEVFNHPKEWMEEFTRRYKAEIGLFFSVMTHPGLLSDKWINSLEQTGARFSINFGLQSGSERVRKEIFDRPTSNKTFDRVIKIVNNHPMKKAVDIIVDNPFETPEESRETALTLFKFRRPLYLQVYSLMFYPGLELTRRAIEAGYAKKDNLPGYTEDMIEMWVPGLEDPDGNPLKTYMKVLVHLHQLRMRSILRPSKEYNPIPVWLLGTLARKKNVSSRRAKAAIRTHEFLVKVALWTYTWGARTQAGYDLIKKRRFGDFSKRVIGVILRGGKRHKEPEAKNECN